MIRRHLIPVLAAVAACSGGCIDLQLALQNAIQESTDGSLPPNDDQNEPDGPGDSDIPVVTLSVSNPAPQLNEEVLLMCSLVGGDADAVTFDFQPDYGRLIVDRRRGTATLIIDPTDIGSTLEFTCTATNEAGTSEPSNEQVIIPTA